MSTRKTHAIIPAALIFAISAAFADAPPPIKPGLWQVHSEREIDGTKMPDMSAHMQDLPPAARERMQAMMKEHGVDIGASGGDMKICLSKESLDAGRWQNMQSDNCKVTYADRTNKHWAWHSVCTSPDVESDGEARFTDSEHYSIDANTKMNMGGNNRTAHMKMTSQWVGADCGDIKPIGSGMMQPQK